MKAAYALWTEERRNLWKERIGANTAMRRPEVRAKVSAALKGRPSPLKGCKQPKISGENHWNYGGKLSRESIERARAAKIGRKQSPEWVANRVKGRAGYRHSEETKERIRQSNLKTYSDPNLRAKNTGPNNPTWHGGPVKIPCTFCSNEIQRAKSAVNATNFCNAKCHGSWLRLQWESSDYRANHSGQNSGGYVSGTWSDPLLRKLHGRIAGNMGKSLKGNKAGYAWESLVGYSVHDLRKRLYRTMPPGNSWQDFLSGKLHIDHIIPIAAFNFRSPGDADFKRCWALKNLRLLPAKENMRKGAKLTAPHQPGLAFG